MQFNRVSSWCLCGFSLISFESQCQKPNILLFLADDVSWNDLGCYGNKEVKTPNIDARAKSICNTE